VRVVSVSSAVVLHAERQPLAGVAAPGPHQLYRWPRLSIDPRPLGPLRPGDLRVRVSLVGICGTDLHIARANPSTGYMLGSVPFDVGPSGRVLGHEGVGCIVDVGDGVTGLVPGDFVTFERRPAPRCAPATGWSCSAPDRSASSRP
jgi:threonine dehydrogenase-like Zn-dependent dehydrogenase